MKLSEKLKANREAIIQIVESSNTSFPRVILDDMEFDLGEMHLDIVVDRTAQYSQGDLSKIQKELEQLLGVSVDVVTPNLLREQYRENILATAVPI